PVRRNGGWLAIFVPIAQLLPPEFLRENLFSALKAVGDFGLRRGQPLVVGEAVHVPDLDTVDEQPVKPGEVAGAFLEGGWMRLLPIARHRTREVHRVLLPRPWTWRLKT